MYKKTQQNTYDIYVKNRKILIPSQLKNIAVQHDHNSDLIKIHIPRYYDGFDLSNHNILLKTETSQGNAQHVFTSETMDVLEDEIVLNWIIKGNQTLYSGVLKIQLSIFSTDFKWQTEVANANITESLDTKPMDDNELSFIEEFIIEIDNKIQIVDGMIQEIQGDIYDVSDSVLQAQQSAEEAKQYSQGIKEHADSARQSAEQAKLIKESTEIFYDVDTVNKRVGFRRANELEFTYTPTLKGDKGDRGPEGPQGPVGPVGPTVDMSNYYNKSETYSKSEVDLKIDEIQSNGVDLTNYYNKQQVDQKITQIELTPGPKGDKGDTGSQGPKGVDGNEVQLQKGSTHIQWKYDNEQLWKDLISIDELKGEPGQSGSGGSQSAQPISSGVDIFNLSYGEYYTKDNNVARQCSNIPGAVTNSFNLQVLRSTQSSVTKVLMLRSYAPNEIWTNTDNFGSWTGWKKVAFEGSASSGGGGSMQKGQKIDFPFLPGFINSDENNKSFIQKTGDFVTVYIHFKPTAGEPSAAETKIGTLPSGYYCDRDLSFAGTETSGNVVKFKIKKTGEVYSLARFYCKDACCIATYQV